MREAHARALARKATMREPAKVSTMGSSGAVGVPPGHPAGGELLARAPQRARALWPQKAAAREVWVVGSVSNAR